MAVIAKDEAKEFLILKIFHKFVDIIKNATMKSILFYPMAFVFMIFSCSKTIRHKDEPLTIKPNSSDNQKKDTSNSGNLRLLFVGNSLTYTNDLPSLLKELGDQDSIKIVYKTFLLPNYALEDHLNKGKVQQEIDTGEYDFVIAQQGPSALPESQVLLLNGATLFANICKKNTKTKLALYMVWPSRSRSFDLDNVIYSYTQAAEKTESLLCPAGLAWKYAWQMDAELPLYGFDNFHPSLTGSVLAALTIYGALRNKKAFKFIQYSQFSWKSEIPEAKFEILKQVALKALTP